MPLKYHCPKCGKRFVEWGAEKLGFKCPDCDDQELVRVGISDDKPSRRSTLKRSTRKAAPRKAVSIAKAEAKTPKIIEDAERIEAQEVTKAVGVASNNEETNESVADGPKLIIDESEEEEVALDVPADLSFNRKGKSLNEGNFNNTNQGQWSS